MQRGCDDMACLVAVIRILPEFSGRSVVVVATPEAVVISHENR